MSIESQFSRPCWLYPMPPVCIAQSSSCDVTPFASDGYTALLDHFDESTTGQANGSVSYNSGPGGLGKALVFGTGSSVVYTLGGWYQWTPDYTPAGKSGAIELWIKPHSTSCGGLSNY